MSEVLKNNKVVFVTELLSIAAITGALVVSVLSSSDSFPLIGLSRILIFHGIAVVLLISSLTLLVRGKSEWLVDVLRWMAVIAAGVGFGYLFNGRKNLLSFTYVVGLAAANKQAMFSMNMAIIGWGFDVAALILISLGGYFKLKKHPDSKK